MKLKCDCNSIGEFYLVLLSAKYISSVKIRKLAIHYQHVTQNNIITYFITFYVPHEFENIIIGNKPIILFRGFGRVPSSLFLCHWFVATSTYVHTFLCLLASLNSQLLKVTANKLELAIVDFSLVWANERKTFCYTLKRNKKYNILYNTAWWAATCQA